MTRSELASGARLMTEKRKLSNRLALACLYERPMHL
jgi:hypothetical protein